MKIAARQRIHDLWDELADFSRADVDGARNHLMSSVALWVRAEEAKWMGITRREPAEVHNGDGGWQIDAAISLKSTPHSVGRRVPAMGVTTPAKRVRSAPLACTSESLAHFDSFRLRQGFRPCHSECREAARLCTGFAVTRNAHSFFVFGRPASEIGFAPAEVEIARYTMRGLKWLHSRFLRDRGLLGRRFHLTPTESRVMHFIVGGASEKQIAAELGQSAHTTHGHIKSLYRKHGVGNRAGLLACWLERGPQPTSQG